MARLSLTSRSYRRTPGSRSPGSGGLAGSLLPSATASGSGPAAGEHREPGEGGSRSRVGGLPNTAAPTAPRALPGYPHGFPRLVGDLRWSPSRPSQLNSAPPD
ncbi:unnamed protein product [Rangifer tarandus platyrhynchus]|uniref:Uncharacterized protein n=1 Tax=Rangifer tarandus platyrhynchus TaxID=3082113 RepID=A0ABN9A0R6_RANTA|nr:unnamed protein product [Rangifer tarandus platyrhynchus]